jgi:hypothetical protein
MIREQLIIKCEKCEYGIIEHYTYFKNVYCGPVDELYFVGEIHKIKQLINKEFYPPVICPYYLEFIPSH